MPEVYRVGEKAAGGHRVAARCPGYPLMLSELVGRLGCGMYGRPKCWGRGPSLTRPPGGH